MKKILSLVLAFVFLLPLNIVSVSALSDDEVTAPSAVLIEPETMKVLYEKNGHEQRACASVTKVMTLILVMEAIDAGKLNWDQMITASAHAASMGGSDIWLEEGEQMSVRDMVKATVVASANDAAVALAEAVSGTEDEFVRQMNEKAKALGMENTVFKNCNGLDEEGHLTTAYDVALMSCELIKHEEIFEFTSIWMDELRDGKTQIVNTNKLLKSYNGITGLKTGTTSQAGSCISATAERDGLSLVAVVLGSETGTDRFKAAATLLDYGFANYKKTNLILPEDAPMEIKVKNGMENSVQLKYEIPKDIITESAKSQLEAKIELPEEIEAPITENQQLGTVSFYSGEEKIAEYPILSPGSSKEVNFQDIFAFMIKNLFTT
ncbi:MAG: D-alanyl-D-alanine carboxypeptidase family protein [Acutalibacteraceae bacterium]|nr:D-alanyl-D-alanine carboxypeptidase family protein [Acutalibacteraceae bacterium]